MLVLSRKLGERVHVGESIVITVVDIYRDKARLGIEAPRDVPIYRQELLPLASPAAVGGIPALQQAVALAREAHARAVARLEAALRAQEGGGPGHG